MTFLLSALFPLQCSFMQEAGDTACLLVHLLSSLFNYSFASALNNLIISQAYYPTALA